MKKATLSTLKQLSNVKEIKDERNEELKGGFLHIYAYSSIELPASIFSDGLGFVPPPGL